MENDKSKDIVYSLRKRQMKNGPLQSISIEQIKMTGLKFKKHLEIHLLKLGFIRHGKNSKRETDSASILIGIQKGFGSQWFINVGFWLPSLGGNDIPEKIESTHLYYRLERLFPEYRETIIGAGDLEYEAQFIELDRLKDLLASDIIPDLCILGLETNLKKALAEGRLKNGMIGKEARRFLAS